MFLLSYLYSLSDVRVCEEVAMHAGFRGFCRLNFDDKVPNRTTLVKIRKRWGEAGVFDEVMRRVVQQCIDAGLVRGRRLGVDGTQVNANAATNSLEPIVPVQPLEEYLQRIRQEDGDSDDSGPHGPQDPPSAAGAPPRRQQAGRASHLISGSGGGYSVWGRRLGKHWSAFRPSSPAWTPAVNSFCHFPPTVYQTSWQTGRDVPPTRGSGSWTLGGSWLPSLGWLLWLQQSRWWDHRPVASMWHGRTGCWGESWGPACCHPTAHLPTDPRPGWPARQVAEALPDGTLSLPGSARLRQTLRAFLSEVDD